MRTTINLPDDIYQAAKSVAQFQGISLGDAIAELIRRGLNPPTLIDTSGPFPKFVVPPDAPPITLERILEAEDEW